MKIFTACFLALSLFSASKIFAQCKAAFSCTSSTSKTLQFTNVRTTGEDSTTTFLWTFGDGDSATADSPLHIFADTGLFTVCLYIHTASTNCSNDTCMQVYIVNCQAYFTWVYDPTFEQPEESVYFFTDSSQGEDSSATYLWNIGGDISDYKNRPWTFGVDDGGPQSACLTIKDWDNSCISTYCDTIDIHPLCGRGDTFLYTRNGSAYTFYPRTCDGFHKAIWDFGDGTSDSANFIPDSVVHTYPSATDSYYVCLTIDYDSLCEQWWAPCTAVYCHAVSPITAMNETSPNSEAFEVYPNPSDKTVVVSVPGLVTPASMGVYDITGRNLKRFMISHEVTEADISELSPGIYLLELENSEGGRASRKLIKE